MNLSPSLYAADPARLGAQMAAVAPHAESWHVDVMDGRFAPAFGLPLPFLAALPGLTDLPFDLHLMIEEPGDWALRLARLRPRRIAFHLETVADAGGLCRAIDAAGCEPVVALRPETPWQPVAGAAGVLRLTAPAGGGPHDAAAAGRPLPPDLPRTLDGGLDAPRIAVLPPQPQGTTLVVGQAIFGDADPGRAAAALARQLTGTTPRTEEKTHAD